VKRKALIIDDEAVLARNLKLYFERSGYRAAVASSAEDGLRKIETDRPDIVLLDLQLPGMSGMDLLLRLKISSPEIRVVMFSGHGSVETAVQALRLGACDFLTKPLELEHLRKVADGILGISAPPPAAAKPAAPATGQGAGLLHRLKRDLCRLIAS
jgi:DNA-binding NtrC family response regulator